MHPNEWILGHDTGISSKVIWGVMTGTENFSTWSGQGTPHDPGDFGRCHRLLELFPAWRARLSEVATRFPMWGPLIREWDRMTEIYIRDLESGRSSELYELMQALRTEGMKAQEV